MIRNDNAQMDPQTAEGGEYSWGMKRRMRTSLRKIDGSYEIAEREKEQANQSWDIIEHVSIE